MPWAIQNTDKMEEPIMAENKLIERALVITNDKSTGDKLTNLLSQIGYPARLVGECLRLKEITNLPMYNVIMIDVDVIDTDQDQLRQIQSVSPQALIMVLAVFGEYKFIINCLRSGAFACVFKPADKDQLAMLFEKAEVFFTLREKLRVTGEEVKRLMGKLEEIGNYNGNVVNTNKLPNPCPPIPEATWPEVEKWLILTTLRNEKGNRTNAAKKLGISIRTLRNKIAEYLSAPAFIKNDQSGKALENNGAREIPLGSLEEVEKWVIQKTLDANSQNRTKTANVLDISIRTLRHKISEYRQGAVLSA